MGQTLSTFDAVLKEFYLPPIVDTLPKKVQLYDHFVKDTESWTGNKVIRDLRLGRNVGIGSRADGGTMPAAGNTTHAEQQIAAKFHYGRIQVSGPTIRASANDQGAFARAVASEVKFTTQDFLEDYDRQLQGDGNAYLAMVETAGTVTSCEVEYAGASSSPTSGEPGTRWLKTGMLVNIGTTAEHLAGTADNVTISSITDRDTFVIASTTVAEHDYITRAGAAAYVNDTYLNEVQGIGYFAQQSGTLQAVVVATYPDWRMQYLDAAAAGGTAGVNRALTWELMQQAIDEAEEFGGGTINLIACHTSMRREVIDMCINDRRYLGPKLDQGYKGPLTFNDIPILFCRNMKYNRLYFLDTTTWKLFVQGGINWMDDDGAILSRVANADAMEALLRYYSNLSCDNPSANTLLTDITVTLRKT